MTPEKWPSPPSGGSTTSKKLGLGFGTLTALLVLSSVATIVRVRSIEGHVGEMANARNRGAAVK